jgi:hypothetical protein
VGADGVPIFTDQRCSDLLAIEQLRPPKPPERPGMLVSVRSCARNQDDFLLGVRSALESGNVNRLADFYHWTGMDTATGYRLMGRLEAFSERPLVEVQLVSSGEPEAGLDPEPDSRLEGFDLLAGTDSDDAASTPRPSRPADLLKVDQMRSNDDLAIQATYLRLRNNAGCWWMQF